MDFSAGTQVNSVVRLVRPLGRGGMGSVWVAEHLMLKTEVVVKFMADALASDPVSLARFSREAAAAAAVKSPHVVQMLDHGFTADGTPFIVMELLEGEDLKTRLLRDHVLPLQDLTLIVSQACKALARAHAGGIVHRDIKPENIFLCHTDDGEPFIKLLDFGIAKSGGPTDFHMTQTGVTVGTPFYMSPEQAMGAPPVDATTDLWSLGVVAYEAMTGERPFDGPTLGALTMAICNHGPPVPSAVNPKIPPSLDAWMARACARDRADRFQTAKAMSDAFVAALGGRATRWSHPDAQAIPLAFEATSISHGSTPPPGVAMTPVSLSSGSVIAVPSSIPISIAPSVATPAVTPPRGSAAVPAAAPTDPAPVASFGTTTNPLSRTHNPEPQPQPLPLKSPPVAAPPTRPRAPYLAGAAVVLAMSAALWVSLTPHASPSAPPGGPELSEPRPAAVAPAEPPPVATDTSPWLPAPSDGASSSERMETHATPSPSATPRGKGSPPAQPPPLASQGAPAPPAASAASAAPGRASRGAAPGAAASVSGTAATPPSCDPPYYFDELHNKVFKKDCF